MTGYHANNLKKLMYQVYVPPAKVPEEEESEAQSSEEQEDPKWKAIQDDEE